MELNLTENKIICCNTPEEKKAVLPMECSIILPDYYPDVMKILRYNAKIVTMPVIPDETGEVASGNVNIEVIYVSEEGELCSCGQLQPFTHNFKREGGKVSAAELNAVCGELSCRAINKRRIDLHGSIELALNVLEAEERTFIENAEGSGSVCKNEKAEVIAITGEYYKTFNIEEKGELGYGRPKFGRAVRTFARAEITECHVMQDKIVTKGEVRVKMLWVPENENEDKDYCISSFSFPISRMIDAPGVLAEDICDARYLADFPEISPSDEEDKIIVKTKVGIFARVYRKSEAEFVTDMFSSDYDCSVEKDDMNLIGEVFPITVTENIFEKMELPENFEKMIDVWAEIPKAPTLADEGKISFFVKLCVLAENSDGETEYYEKSLEKEIFSPAGDKKTAFFSLCSDVVSEDCNMTRNGTAEISINVLIDGTIYTSVKKRALAECSLNCEKPNERSKAALVLYYAEKGEHVWDIAKNYKVYPKKIIDENKITDGVISEKTMLVIPN